MRTVRVEFIGTPASGKSTASCAIAGRLSLEWPRHRVIWGDDVWLRLLRRRRDGFFKDALKRLPLPLARHLKLTLFLPEFVRATAQRPQWVGEHLGAIAREGYAPSVVHMLVFAFVQTLCETQCARGHLQPGDILLQDEGLCQRAFSVFGYSETPVDAAAIEGYLDGIDVPDVLIKVETDAAVCHERLLKRPHYHELIAKYPNGERVARLRQAQDCVNRVAQGVGQRGGLVISVDGSDVGACSEPLAERLLTMVRGESDGE